MAVRWWLIRHRLRVIVHRIRFPGMPMFSEAAANALVGKRIIVGITNRSDDGRVVDLEEYDCRILRASEGEGIVMQADSGELLTFPPDLRPYFGAPPGEYRFKRTGHVALDPDLQTTWTRTLP